jgi:hypothetical protein
MESNRWIDRLYDDEAMTDGLADNEAEMVLSWAENHLATCESEQEALHLLDNVRLLSRYVQEGENFDHLFTALKANASRPAVVGDAPCPGDRDAGTETIYPPDC